ncbi:MAG: MarR family transcriptional regulator [Ignavibacterium sp.]
MVNNNFEFTAEKLADLTFQLLASCQEKENRLARQYNLTDAEFRCLRSMTENEFLNNKEIAERMNLSPSRLTRIIDGLVKKGYVKREIQPNDRRNMQVYLSEKGIDFVKQLNRAYVNIHTQILSEIDKSQHKPLIEAMDNLLRSVNNWLLKS